MDRLPQLLTDLLDCAVERLSLKPCRSFLHAGPNAPWDSCEVSGESNGQVWVAHRQSFPGWPSSTGQPVRCNQIVWAAEVELGIARCQQGKVGDNGELPTQEDVTADAALQQLDRYELLQALTCCWPVENLDLIFDRWEALEPSGGCVVSRWVVRVRVGTCGCDRTS